MKRDDVLDETFGHKKRVGFLVTDMTYINFYFIFFYLFSRGFTKTVREKGPIHFGSLIMKQRHIVQSVLSHYKSSHSYNEGDDVIAILDSGKTATLAALEITHLIRLSNSTTGNNTYLKVNK